MGSGFRVQGYDEKMAKEIQTNAERQRSYVSTGAGLVLVVKALVSVDKG